ncbi:MAG TPA: thioesterase family protein [Gammaproteobacteria bacterium]|nr:thioesterase family protein [Gammaproteobacteria bacterium]
MSEIKKNSVARPDDLTAVVRDMFESRIAFNRMLGLKIISIGSDEASVRLAMRGEFVGNYTRGILHGGVISATLDATAGLVAYSSLAQDSLDMSRKERLARFSRVGTIDMRVDFLRPGRGDFFIASARTLRKGSRVAVIHTEMHDQNGEMIASGTCTYMVG